MKFVACFTASLLMWSATFIFPAAAAGADLSGEYFRIEHESDCGEALADCQNGAPASELDVVTRLLCHPGQGLSGLVS